MYSFNQRECLGCGLPCDVYHYSCACQQCGVILLNGICLNCIHEDGKPITCCECKDPLRGGFCLVSDSKAENSFTYDPNAYSFNETSSNFNHLPKPQYETYLCKLCGNDSHYGYDYQPQFSLVYEQEPSYNQNYNDNYYSHDSPSFLCCDNCGESRETFQCQPMNQNTDSSGFDQIQTPQYLVIHHPSQEMSKEIFQAKENLMKSIQTFLEKFNCISFGEKPKILLQAWEKFFAIQHAQPEDTNELFQKLLEDLQIINEKLAEYINSLSWNRPTFFNDNEEHSNFRVKKSSTSLKNTSQIFLINAIAPILPTKEPEYSLSMGESEVTFDDESECDVPVKDESSPVFTTFSNPLFDCIDDFTSSDDESLSNEDVLMENFKVYLNPLFDDEEINYDEIDPHYFNVESDFVKSLSNHDTLFDFSPRFDYLEEFSGKLMPISINSCPRPMENFHANTIVETLSTSHIPIEDSDSQRDEIDIFTGTDYLLPPGIKSEDYDSEGDIHFLEELLINDSISLPENESSNFDHHDNPSFPRPPLEPPDVEVFFDFKPSSGELISAMKNNIDDLDEDECFDP
uniref:Pre-mRNA splicing Prp18-interacting factor n=1 Tax=Tanacetum cinerariifolium TaxID=118510 RepID=A0A699IR67_TANCI|nr:hypothetical protein [Tanacetum cinerariifolium]